MTLSHPLHTALSLQTWELEEEQWGSAIETLCSALCPKQRRTSLLWATKGPRPLWFCWGKCTTLPPLMHATSATLIFHQSDKSTPTTGLACCFPLPLALTAQHRHSSLCFPSQCTWGAGWCLLPVSSGFILFSEWLFFFYLFLNQPEPMLDFMLNTEWPLGVSPYYLDMSYVISVDYFFYPYYF